MILCTFAQIANYASLNPLFAKASEWISNTNLQELEHGKTMIYGEELFAIKETLPGRKAEKANLEAHKKYIDIQICLKGVDDIKWKPTEECKTILQAYQEKNDIMFFMDNSVHFIKVYDDKVAIFFPEDAHAPLIADETLTKLVIKVAVN